MNWESWLAVLCGGIVGVTLGATGAGGSLLAIPLLVYGVGLRVQEATALSLIVVGLSAGLGAVRYLKAGEIRLKAAVLFSASGSLGAWVGAFGHRMVREQIILGSFGFLMLGVAWRIWREQGISPASPWGESCADRLPRTCVVRVLFIGLAVGLLTGFFGVGGGFLIVPALSMILGFPISVAVGTSLLIIALVSLGGVLGHLHYGRIDWSVAAYLLLGGGLGMLAGTELGRRASPAYLSRQFAVVAAAVAVTLVVHNGIILIRGGP
jgi:uncharacterized membrane protein YfcA